MVLEPPGNRLVDLVQQPQSGIAVDHRGDDHPEAVDIGDLGKAQVLLVHLAVDRVQRLFAARDPHIHSVRGEDRFDLTVHFLDQVAAPIPGLGHGFVEDRITPGSQMPEGKFLQFAVGLVQAQPVRDGRVNLQCLRRNPGPLLARHIVQRAHVVGAVRQLDQDDAHVSRHRQQHLAE